MSLEAEWEGVGRWCTFVSVRGEGAVALWRKGGMRKVREMGKKRNVSQDRSAISSAER